MDSKYLNLDSNEKFVSMRKINDTINFTARFSSILRVLWNSLDIKNKNAYIISQTLH